MRSSNKNRIVVMDGDSLAYRASWLGQEARWTATEQGSGRTESLTWGTTKTQMRTHIEEEYGSTEGWTLSCTIRTKPESFYREVLAGMIHSIMRQINVAIIETGEQAWVAEYEIYLTADGRSHNFRDRLATILPYKGHRGERPVRLPFVRNVLRDDWSAKDVLGMEADDMLTVRLAQDPDSVILVHDDKDILQVAGDHFNLRTKTMRTIEEQEGNRLLYAQIVSGDASDNIPGLYKLLCLQGRDKEAATLRGRRYLSKVRKALEEAQDEQEMAWIVRQVFERFGYGDNELNEIGGLVYLRRRTGDVFVYPEGDRYSPPPAAERVCRTDLFSILPEPRDRGATDDSNTDSGGARPADRVSHD